jgi:predicted transposase YdaD
METDKLFYLAPSDTAPDAPLVFLQVILQPDDEFYARWFSSIFTFLHQQGGDRDWKAIVIYPDRATERPPPPAFAPLLDLPRIKRVYLEDIAGQPSTSLDMELLQLLIAEPDAAIVKANALLEAYRDRLHDPEQWPLIDLALTILIYKLPDLPRERIQAVLHVPDIDLKQTAFYQEAVAEGRQLGEVALILRQLRRRCGPLTPDQETRVQALPVNDLETLGEALLDFQTVADLTAWLQQHP